MEQTPSSPSCNQGTGGDTKNLGMPLKVRPKGFKNLVFSCLSEPDGPDHEVCQLLLVLDGDADAAVDLLPVLAGGPVLDAHHLKQSPALLDSKDSLKGHLFFTFGNECILFFNLTS